MSPPEQVTGNQEDREKRTGYNKPDSLDGFIEKWDIEEVKRERQMHFELQKMVHWPQNECFKAHLEESLSPG